MTIFTFNYSIRERPRQRILKKVQNERKTSMDRKKFFNLAFLIKNWIFDKGIQITLNEEICKISS